MLEQAGHAIVDLLSSLLLGNRSQQASSQLLSFGQVWSHSKSLRKGGQRVVEAPLLFELSRGFQVLGDHLFGTSLSLEIGRGMGLPNQATVLLELGVVSLRTLNLSLTFLGFESLHCCVRLSQVVVGDTKLQEGKVRDEPHTVSANLQARVRLLLECRIKMADRFAPPLVGQGLFGLVVCLEPGFGRGCACREKYQGQAGDKGCD